MSIPVIFYDNTEDYVPDFTLEQLLSAHRIKMFYRFSEGWVTVEAGLLRGKGGRSAGTSPENYPEACVTARSGAYSGTYAGPERRMGGRQYETGREQLELWSSRELIRRIYEDSPVGIGLCDSFGKLLDANRSYLELFGLDAISGAGAFNLFIDPAIPSDLKDRMRCGETVRCRLVVDFDQVRTSGLYETGKSGVITLEMLVSPIVVASPGMCLYVVQVHDISLQREAEEKVQTIQQSAAIVVEAAALADDLNNLLQVVLGNIYLARQLETPGRETAKFLERAETASLSATALTARLTAFPCIGMRDRAAAFSDSSRTGQESGDDGSGHEKAARTPGEAGRVLVMDDTESVRRIAGAFLIRLGYAVEFAQDGDEAIRIYEAADREGKPFDVVLLDLTVAGGRGARETIGKMLERDPDVRAIVSSGYHDDPVMAAFSTYGFSGAIAKPYTLEELGRTVSMVKHRRA